VKIFLELNFVIIIQLLGQLDKSLNFSNKNVQVSASLIKTFQIRLLCIS